MTKHILWFNTEHDITDAATGESKKKSSLFKKKLNYYQETINENNPKPACALNYDQKQKRREIVSKMRGTRKVWVI